MTLDTTLGIAGLVLGIASFIYAIHQQRKATALKKYQIGKLRSNLKDCIVVMSQSYRLAKLNQTDIPSPEVFKKISVVHTASCSLIRSIFHELSELDTPYNYKKLLQYISADLITSKWVWKQAAMFVQSEMNEAPPDLPEDTKDWMNPES